MAETSTKKRLSATVYYLLTGIALGWPGLFASGRLLADWKAGNTLMPLSLAAIHSIVLGFMVTIAFGVLYQIVPIAFQAPPVSRRVLVWHLPLHVVSVLVMVIGFMDMRYVWVGIGGTLLVCSAAAYFAIILSSYLRARNKTVVHKGLVLPFVSFWGVVTLGIVQAFFPDAAGNRVVFTHVLLGGFAFWGGLVLVFSYKLVPMFAISHGYKASLVRTASLYFSGIALLILALWLPAGWQALRTAGAVLAALGLISFSVDVVAMVRARKRRRLVLPLYDSFLSNAGIVLGHLWMLIAIVCNQPGWLYPAAYLFWLGGLIPLMFSYMQKMVPFLWFEYRFSKRPERKTAPLIDDMVPRRTAQIGFGLYYVGILTGLSAITWGPAGHPQPAMWNMLDWVSAALATAGSITLFSALRYVLTIGGRRPEDGNQTPASSTP